MTSLQPQEHNEVIAAKHVDPSKTILQRLWGAYINQPFSVLMLPARHNDTGIRYQIVFQKQNGVKDYMKYSILKLQTVHFASPLIQSQKLRPTMVF